MGIRLGLSLLFLTAPLWAQENPRELWTTMRTQRNRPAEETEESLVEAARLFDLADVKSAEDRKEIGRTAAVALFQYLDLVEWPSRRRIPTALTEETWTYKKILAIKREDGRWLISAATRRASSNVCAGPFSSSTCSPMTRPRNCAKKMYRLYFDRITIEESFLPKPSGRIGSSPAVEFITA